MMFRRLFSTYFFTALAVIALTLQTYGQLHLVYDPWMLAFVGIGSLVGYNGYVILYAWRAEQWRIKYWSQSLKNWRLWLMLLCLLLEVVLLEKLDSGLQSLLAMALFFLGYVWIRKPRMLGFAGVGKLKTLLLPLIWLYVTMGLPAMENSVQMKANFFLMLLHRYGFLFLVAVFFDLRDVEKDREMAMETLVAGWRPRDLVLVAFLAAIASSTASFLSTDLWSGLFLNIPIWIIFFLIVSYKRIKSPQLFMILGDGIMIVSTGLYFLGRFFINCPA
jgi:hypothetical protein